MNHLKQKQITVDDEDYVLKKFPAMIGLDLQMKIGQGDMSAETIQKLICKGVAKGSVDIDAKMFDNGFAGRYAHLFRLVEEVIKFNFEDEYGPNEESASEE